MKIRVTFKTPDALNDAVDAAARDATDAILDSAEKKEVQGDMRVNLQSACERWIRDGEYEADLRDKAK